MFAPPGSDKSQGLPFAYCRLSVCNVPVAVIPVTANADNVPTEVMFGWAAVVIVEAVPVTLPTIPAVTVRPLKVPTEVMFGCAAVVNVPATVVNDPAVPETLPAPTFPVTSN